MQFNAIGEYDFAPTKLKAARILSTLSAYSPVVAASATPGRTEVTITFDADLLLLAATIGASTLISHVGELTALTVMSTEEYDRRTDLIEPVGAGELVSTAAAAEILGVTRQRIQQLAASGSIPSRKIGRSLAIPLTAVTALKHQERLGEHAPVSATV